MHANKGQRKPSIFLTPLNYSEIGGSPTRTKSLPETPSLIVFSVSLLMKTNSLFRKNFSLIPDLKFPVNFEAQMDKTYESPVTAWVFTHTVSEIRTKIGLIP